MRLWSLHPSLLDRQGLMGLWREALLARHVLLGLTKGYTKHPQLQRFRSHKDSLLAIDFYLAIVCQEGRRRGYKFDSSKFKSVEELQTIESNFLKEMKQEVIKEEKSMSEHLHAEEYSSLPANIHSLPVHSEQADYELQHLKNKLKKRTPSLLEHIKYSCASSSLLHPLFHCIPGPIEDWERPFEVTEPVKKEKKESTKAIKRKNSNEEPENKKINTGTGVLTRARASKLH